MREVRLPLIPSVLASALLALLLTPMSVIGASGLPATITMSPANAGPGSTVEVVGIDFPAGQPLEISLTTTSGQLVLDETTVEAGGYFRTAVTFPDDVAPGFWELRATAGDGRTAVHIFESLAGRVVAPAVEAPVTQTPVASGGGIDGTLVTLVVLALLIGGVGGASIYVWGLLKHPKGDPGMATGDDPIWAAGDMPAPDVPTLVAPSEPADPVLAGSETP